jgi:hypothetical protein
MHYAAHGVARRQLVGSTAAGLALLPQLDVTALGRTLDPSGVALVRVVDFEKIPETDWAACCTMSLKLSVGPTPKTIRRAMHSSPNMRRMIAELNTGYKPDLDRSGAPGSVVQKVVQVPMNSTTVFATPHK